MPGGPAASGWEEQVSQNGLACPICMEFLCEPLLLECGHSFCRLCLLQSSRLAPDGRHCPNCRGNIRLKDPASHPADAALMARVLEVVPLTQVTARRVADQEKLVALLETAERSLPVFYMRGAASRVGELVALHLFEPRYRILIRRAWEGNHRFLCAQREPRNGDRGLIVEVERVSFCPDGKADIRGRGLELVTLRGVRVEAGTAGLYYADVGTAERGESRRPADGEEGGAIGAATVVTQAQALLAAALREGAAKHSAGDYAGCTGVYRRAAQRSLEILPREGSGAATALVAMLREGEERAAGAVAAGDPKGAAEALKRTFDGALALPLRPEPEAAAVAGAARPGAGGSREERELPVFYFPPGATVGSTVRLRFFEQRYKVLARDVWAAERLFVYASALPVEGATASVVRLDRCQWDVQDCANVQGVVVDTICLGAVRQVEGLYYAKVPVRPDLARAAPARDEGTAPPPVKCCVMQ